MSNKKKKNQIPDDVVRTILNQDVVPEREETPEDVTAYDLAMLAAEVCPGFQDPHKAIKKAWELLKASELHLQGIALEALVNSPQAGAEWREQEEKRLAGLRITYDDLKRVVTGHLKHYDRADKWFNRFLDAKAKKEGKNEVWVEALKLTYRNKTFTGTEAKKIQEQYRQWQGYRGQGRVTGKGDLRLRENKKKNLEKAQKAAGSQTKLTKSELEQLWGEKFSDSRLIKPKRKVEQFWDSNEARRTAAEKRSAKLKRGS
jgi:hypothetical protein